MSPSVNEFLDAKGKHTLEFNGINGKIENWITDNIHVWH